MMKKVLPLVALVAGFALLFASIGFANVPAPPVNQDIGFPDLGELGALTEGDCRGCHDSGVPDRHHMLFGSTIPDPSIVPIPDADGIPGADTNYGCLNCHAQDTSSGVTNFLVERDCTVCHTGDSPHHATNLALVDGNCVACHGDLVDNWDDGHYIPTYSPSLVTPSTRAWVTECEISGIPCGDDSDCTANVCELQGTACAIDSDCAVNLCEDGETTCTTNDDCDPGHCRDNSAEECHRDSDCNAYGSSGCSRYDDCYAADVCVAEGEACVDSSTAKVGGCNYCHDAGTDTASGLDIVDNHDTHHGVDINWILPGESRECYSCHTTDDYHSTDIRKCETCHGPESLHSIVADSDDAGTDIVVGGENAGYSHVGNNSDCWGCHGFETAGAFSAGPGVPSISSAAPLVIIEGTATPITVTGVAFTSTLGTTLYTSIVVLTAEDGSKIELTPDAISQGSLTVTVNVAAGIYSLQAVKAGEASSPVGIAVLPKVIVGGVVTSATCAGCNLTITGSNFGEQPEGSEVLGISVIKGGMELNIKSWTDTRIEASAPNCNGAVTVNSVYGSATK